MFGTAFLPTIRHDTSRYYPTFFLLFLDPTKMLPGVGDLGDSSGIM